MSFVELQGRMSLSAAQGQFDVGVDTCFMAAGDYYPATLAAEMQTVIQLYSAAHSTATVSYSTTNGQFEITLDGIDSISFDDTYLAQLLGHSTDTLSGASSYVSDQNPRGVWRPSREPSGHGDVELKTLWTPRSQTITGRSHDGSTYSIPQPTLYDAVLEFMHLTRAETVTPTTGSVYADFEQWFEDVIAVGSPIQILPDRTDSATVRTALVAADADEAAPVGSMGDYTSRRISTFLGYYSVTLPLIKVV